MTCFLSLTTLRFVKRHLHGGPPDSLDAEALKKEVEELRQKNKDLEDQVAQLQTAVSLHDARHVCKNMSFVAE